MLKIDQIRLPYTAGEDKIQKAIVKKLNIPEKRLISWSIGKRSIDARRKPDIRFIYTVYAHITDEPGYLKRCKDRDIKKAELRPYRFAVTGTKKLDRPIVIAGTGPAGLFAGLMLARAGYCPILLEQGMDVDRRMRAVQDFWEGKPLDLRTNVQFGEGGAGTFSDGKLNTLVKDPAGRKQQVLDIFVLAGAPEHIRYDNKPHIGTDILCRVVKNIREEICRLGGSVFFDSKVTDITTEQGAITQVTINGRRKLPCAALVLAVGHSARDTYVMLRSHGMAMTAKAFAMGLRVEHPQAMIDQAQYGLSDHETLGPADYKLTARTSGGRGVYSFCMCPGGYVVNASSEADGTVVNGMSYHGRAGENANSAIVATVTPEDFPSDDPLSGVAFQRRWERAAYAAAGGGGVPIQLYKDFRDGKVSDGFGQVKPQHKGGVVFADLNACLPEGVRDSIKEAIPLFGKKIPGFDREDALLSGVETRTSSPVRMERDDALTSNIDGIYPCGEGAGYAGGITSAAMDGLRVAEALAALYAPDNALQTKKRYLRDTLQMEDTHDRE